MRLLNFKLCFTLIILNFFHANSQNYGSSNVNGLWVGSKTFLDYDYAYHFADLPNPSTIDYTPFQGNALPITPHFFCGNVDNRTMNSPHQNSFAGVSSVGITKGYYYKATIAIAFPTYFAWAKKLGFSIYDGSHPWPSYSGGFQWQDIPGDEDYHNYSYYFQASETDPSPHFTFRMEQNQWSSSSKQSAPVPPDFCVYSVVLEEVEICDAPAPDIIATPKPNQCGVQLTSNHEDTMFEFWNVWTHPESPVNEYENGEGQGISSNMGPNTGPFLAATNQIVEHNICLTSHTMQTSEFTCTACETIIVDPADFDQNEGNFYGYPNGSNWQVHFTGTNTSNGTEYDWSVESESGSNTVVNNGASLSVGTHKVCIEAEDNCVSAPPGCTKAIVSSGGVSFQAQSDCSSFCNF